MDQVRRADNTVSISDWNLGFKKVSDIDLERELSRGLFLPDLNDTLSTKTNTHQRWVTADLEYTDSRIDQHARIELRKDGLAMTLLKGSYGAFGLGYTTASLSGCDLNSVPGNPLHWDFPMNEKETWYYYFFSGESTRPMLRFRGPDYAGHTKE